MIQPASYGVPKFSYDEFHPKSSKYCLCIPIINEGDRILCELTKAKNARIHEIVDIVICDGGSTDGSTNQQTLIQHGVNSLLIKDDKGRQGAQLRMGIWWCLNRGYEAILTIDGNNKDSIEDVPLFLKKIEAGYDFIQGSRYIPGGQAIHTPIMRTMAVRLIHAPLISLAANYHFTDTTNAYRAYSRRYLENPKVMPLRDLFQGYELLAYLSVRATQLGLKACEIPVRREYPAKGHTPTKIKFFQGNLSLLHILFKTLLGKYNP